MGKFRDLLDSFDFPGNNFDRLNFLYDLLDNEFIEQNDWILNSIYKTDSEESVLKGLSNRRSEMDIIALILKIARKGAMKTKILYQANLSYHQMRNYFVYLIKIGLLEKEKKSSNKNQSFKTTLKGNLFLCRKKA
jgi:predicted transcriptional regulator